MDLKHHSQDLEAKNALITLFDEIQDSEVRLTLLRRGYFCLINNAFFVFMSEADRDQYLGDFNAYLKLIKDDLAGADLLKHVKYMHFVIIETVASMHAEDPADRKTYCGVVLSLQRDDAESELSPYNCMVVDPYNAQLLAHTSDTKKILELISPRLKNFVLSQFPLRNVKCQRLITCEDWQHSLGMVVYMLLSEAVLSAPRYMTVKVAELVQRGAYRYERLATMLSDAGVLAESPANVRVAIEFAQGQESASPESKKRKVAVEAQASDGQLGGDVSRGSSVSQLGLFRPPMHTHADFVNQYTLESFYQDLQAVQQHIMPEWYALYSKHIKWCLEHHQDGSMDGAVMNRIERAHAMFTISRDEWNFLRTLYQCCMRIPEDEQRRAMLCQVINHHHSGMRNAHAFMQNK